MISKELRNENWDNTDWLYIVGLSKAIENVTIEYIRNNVGDNTFHVEHVFAYELYSKWKEELNNAGSNPKNLLLNGELTKHYCKTASYKFPDMVLHKHYDNNDYQCVICEIKSSRNGISDDALIKDMISLHGGTTELSYKCGVFIYLGDDAPSMVLKLQGILEELGIDVQKKIIFVGVNGAEPHYQLL